MLSKTDIQKELGKGICIYPLDLKNIKENSVNLCTGDYAWSLSSGTVYYNEAEPDKNKKFSLKSGGPFSKSCKIFRCGSAVVKTEKNEKYIVLLPMSTTLIETREVLSVGNYIGGTYHSKVGLVSRGIGHIGTMVGPNFSGESLIAIHNVSKDLLVLNVGESFVSVIFYYLRTKISQGNPTVSGHTDKFSEFGIILSQNESEELNADWKKQFESVKAKMCESDTYRQLQKILQEQRFRRFRQFFSKKNLSILLASCSSFFSCSG